MDPFPRLPDFAAFASGLLDCGDGHSVFFSQRGTPSGVPILLLHGGPGSGSSPRQAAFFDPARFHIVQFDQRGSGLSLPRGGIVANSTAHLVDDIERLRRHLGIARWLVAGGSWGATLAAVYAARHRRAVLGLLLRGFFLASRREIEAFMSGARKRKAEAWASLVQAVPIWAHRQRLLWLNEVFHGGDHSAQRRVALAWAKWERALSGLSTDWSADESECAALLQRYRVQVHYLCHACWLGEARVLRACRGLSGLPAIFLHGREDMICRPAAALRAQRAARGSQLRWIDGAGHDPFHPAMAAAMQEAIADLTSRVTPTVSSG